MEDDKFLGEPSNPNNSRSLLNNNNNSNANNLNSTNTSNTGHRPSSSTQNKHLSSANTDDSSTYGDGGDDIGWWDCSLCTYKNSADKFKCEICDLRRGTSTRKPRCNADTIVAQVVKQQEQIRQQTRVKTPKNRSGSSLNAAAASSSTDSTAKAKCRSRYSESRSRQSTQDNDDNSDDDISSDSVSSPNAKPPKKKKALDTKAAQKSNGKVSKNPKKHDNENSTDSDSTDATDDLSRASSVGLRRSASESSIDSIHYSSSSLSEQANTSPLPSKAQENPLKITPLEVNGNLIKYSPPTSSGRTGLIIDKKRFTQHSVTVNDVTITFTEFATRQNKYIRKKKKRRENSKPKSNNGNGKSRTKGDAKSNQNAPSTAAGDA